MVCVCVCVRKRERKREKEGERVRAGLHVYAHCMLAFSAFVCVCGSGIFLFPFFFGVYAIRAPGAARFAQVSLRFAGVLKYTSREPAGGNVRSRSLQTSHRLRLARRVEGSGARRGAIAIAIATQNAPGEARRMRKRPYFMSVGPKSAKCEPRGFARRK